MNVIVYVPLLGEGVDVWRPVEATRIGDALYRLAGSQPDGEVWAFAEGELVRCRPQQLSGGEVLVAYESVGSR